MRYGQRLRTARGNLTQAALSERSGVSQSLISQLETSETATGSEYTNRLARALGVSPDWLADEIGEMRPSFVMVSEPRVAAIASTLLRAMEDGKEYLVERTQKDLDADLELIAQATARAKTNDR